MLSPEPVVDSGLSTLGWLLGTIPQVHAPAVAASHDSRAVAVAHHSACAHGDRYGAGVHRHADSGAGYTHVHTHEARACTYAATHAHGHPQTS
jgi:hypothetical protein